MLARKRKKCARLVGELLDRFHRSQTPAEAEARKRLIVLCALCGKCRIEPS